MTSLVGGNERTIKNAASPSATQARQALAVAKLASFSKAAAALDSSQSAVSNAIAALEEQLGLTLFVRSTRSVRPTAAFRTLRKHFERLLTATERVDAVARSIRGSNEGTLRIGISPVVDTDRIEATIRQFERHHRDVDVDLIELNLKDLLRDLENRELDVVIAPQGERKAWLKSVTLYEEPLLLVRSRDSRAEPTVVLKSVANEVFLMVPDVCGLARATTALFAAEKTRLHRAKTQALGYHLLERAALAGRGLAILPRSKISDGVKGSFVVLSSGLQARLAVQVAHRRAGRLSVNQRAFVEALRNDPTYSSPR